MIVLAVIGLQCCRPTDKAESMGDTITAVDHVVVNAPNAPGSEPIGDRIQTAMFLEKVGLMATLETEWGKLAAENNMPYSIPYFFSLTRVTFFPGKINFKI